MQYVTSHNNRRKRLSCMQNSGWGLPRSVERGPHKSRSAFMDPDDRAITVLQCILCNQLDAQSDWRPGGRGFNPCRGRQHSFMEIDHEIFSMFILSLPLIQEGQLSVSRERMCTILVNRLED